jgi:hypothetical protein
MPYPTNTEIAVQNNTTGVVDYLQFQGSQLVASDAINYMGPGWNLSEKASHNLRSSRILAMAKNYSVYL